MAYLEPIYGVPSHALVAAVPRPVGLVPGLAVGKTLVLSSDVMGCVQLVEVFIYPGKGHVLCTAPNVSNPYRAFCACQSLLSTYLMRRVWFRQDACKRMAELGVFFVKNDWGLVCERYPEIEPRKNPLDGDYDLHVNIPLEQAAPWVSAALHPVVPVVHRLSLYGVNVRLPA